MAKRFSYGKEEKLKRRKLIDEVFRKGRSFVIHPIKLIYLPYREPTGPAAMTGVGVSAKSFRRAVDRNRIKRLLRESYRLEKQPLHEYLHSADKKVLIFILYIDRSLPDFSSLRTKMHLVLNRLIKQLNETSAADT